MKTFYDISWIFKMNKDTYITKNKITHKKFLFLVTDAKNLYKIQMYEFLTIIYCIAFLGINLHIHCEMITNILQKDRETWDVMRIYCVLKHEIFQNTIYECSNIPSFYLNIDILQLL